MKLSQIRVYFLYFFQIIPTNNIFLLESLNSFIFLYHYNKCYPSQPRVAAKIFVSIISRNFLEIFNCVFCEIFLEYREISRKTKLKFGWNFRNFARHEIKICEHFCYFAKKRWFFISKFVKKLFIIGTQCSSNMTFWSLKSKN